MMTSKHKLENRYDSTDNKNEPVIKRPRGRPKNVNLLNNSLTLINKSSFPVSDWKTIKDEFNISDSWSSILEPETKKSYFQYIMMEYKRRCQNEEVLPIKEDIFSWTRFVRPEDIKVVIIGQDPYHGPGQAHGLAFSVRKGVPIPPSLRNIFLALKKNYPSFIIPNHGYLEDWAKQGVLLLNTTLTVKRGTPGSHSSIGWNKLTRAVIDILSSHYKGLVFMLWGAHAKSSCNPNPNDHLILTFSHPSPLSSTPFINCNHFIEANSFLSQQGKEIDWTIN
ncbi:uracil-DNA glycosylase [Canid alphaherpesvirus 1]|uniref:Uracil-DNA glycosylase n=1 Tax=Canid alphaherpesvirus 1 TaxID=170325 RepID=A0A172DS90_9ALPH|nr:uracil-DNA glycosylase [Canid alphaherpesvirus 1]ALL25934.1 uracil-DNA glycosylase [Canid alphaherpesvirus 1]ALL26015.1 uracil-DNA glycosylase [Canid alphaherpesvirus 1]ALL26090.1 uracil-DNA glycosylase [Canid alphaherpesvirus 1]AQX83372.1 uracil-DNA glycosylase [Canid alphaherpesvirus 1]ARE29861.1 uracil-DNA glycosylase [Canid alphaherpesvirus 1]